MHYFPTDAAPGFQVSLSVYVQEQNQYIIFQVVDSLLRISTRRNNVVHVYDIIQLSYIYQYILDDFILCFAFWS